MNPNDAKKAAVAPNLEKARPTDADSSAAVNPEVHGISPQDPDSMPRDDDHPGGVAGSPEFTDRPGQGSEPGTLTVDLEGEMADVTNKPNGKDLPSLPTDDMEPMTGGDQDVDTAGTEADDSKGSLDQRVADAADEAGSAFLPHDKVLSDPKDKR